MRIERIDDKTVKCYLSQEELAEYEITYKDFVTRTQKAKEMVEHIIAQAVEEVGYKPPEFAMDMQIMLMPDQGLILTLSEELCVIGSRKYSCLKPVHGNICKIKSLRKRKTSIRMFFNFILDLVVISQMIFWLIQVLN